jgi:pyruvate/2-oxoglutarate dehydrogenase complex dihydrolipoamide dehydrogenase (E3) component
MNDRVSNFEEYDVLILGSGQAGTFLAWTLANQGQRVAVVERKYIGGACPNIACLPVKNIVHSAKVASLFYRSEEFGITKDNVKINMAGVRERKGKMVHALNDWALGRFKATGVEYIVGSGCFVGPKIIEVSLPDGGKRLLRGENTIISTGTRATIERIPGFTEASPLTHVEALELDRIPEHILVIGGGFVGLEFAQAMRRFGSRVTIIDRNDRLAHQEDLDVSTGIHELFKDEGIDIVLNAHITHIEGKSGTSVKLHMVQPESKIILEGTHLLVAAGRTPNTNCIGLDATGVEVTNHGYIKVNERLETTAPGVWAVGDCAGSPHFTHVAHDDFRIVRDNLAGGHRVTTGRQVPYCVFTDPEFARIGLNEIAAKAQGISYRMAKLPMAAIPRPITLSETRGFMKALVEAKGDRILGFSVFGVGAGDVIAVVQIAMLAGLPYTALRDAILTHPTLPEGLDTLFSNMPSDLYH